MDEVVIDKVGSCSRFSLTAKSIEVPYLHTRVAVA